MRRPGVRVPSAPPPSRLIIADVGVSPEESVQAALKLIQRDKVDILMQTGTSGQLQPALELFAMVDSQQDPGVAILTRGIPDLPYDLGYPTPPRQYRAGRLHRPGRGGALRRWRGQPRQLLRIPEPGLGVAAIDPETTASS